MYSQRCRYDGPPPPPTELRINEGPTLQDCIAKFGNALSFAGITLVADESVPDGEIHAYSGGRCVGKIVGAAEPED